MSGHTYIHTYTHDNYYNHAHRGLIIVIADFQRLRCLGLAINTIYLTANDVLQSVNLLQALHRCLCIAMNTS